ncbi:disease resistance protein Roq1-like isoform X2 [Phaseolus vulgaris]|uniref:disease resistance protein Roq1-like isoform X2 n=1 Tax=Phaseolus vulgaris TaxID=3885 RepID=UPI0035CAD4B7
MGKHGEEEERLGFTYDVFISFRGEDTRNTFIGHLRRELGRMGIKSFNDDRNMRIGESLSPALSKAIEESKIFIVVFSEKYASSTWCLDELVRIIERSKMKKKMHLVYPVFYHVDPSDIEHERNSFGKHMKAHEKEIGKESQRMQDWRSAFSQAAVDFQGRHISTGGQNPVGLDACIEEVMSLLEMKPYDKTVNMLGIYGLGGIGKTELAIALYNTILQHFDAASFLSDVREKSSRINGIKDLQKTLLSEMFEELETELGSTSKGMTEIEEKLQKKKVLLVLDDVGDKDQLENLAGGGKWFGPGSRIIITTREKDVLISHQVKNMYEMKELDDLHSLELFCWNAFRQSYPKTGFEDVSLRAVDYAKGLPLALKRIGSDLATFHESLEDWEMAMEEYERTPNKKIQDVLKISYDKLDDKAKQISLFISFRGEDTRYTFIGHLRRELGRRGIKSFNDDRNMRIGESLPPALSKAIEESKIFIVVFSENYASSTRCLDELVRIIERSKMKEKKQLVYPVFYHVDPSDIRHERNSFGKHMKAHEHEIGKESQKMQAWRSALSQAFDFPGRHIITTGDDESYCIEEIVEKVHEYIIPKPLYSGQNPIGLEACIEEVMSLLDMKPDDKTVNMLGIYGLGGIGKTELAKALYDKIVQHFDAASFLSDVREKSNRINGMEDLQKTLLSKMFEELETKLESTIKGMGEIKEKLQKKKVLLVLDDVGDKDQLEKLAGECNWFGPGSRIIITTREENVLIAHQVKPTYEMKELDDQHSLQLFCWNAFRQSYPKTGFEDVSVRAVDYAKGLPLALKVIGSDLAAFHESLEDWEMAMKEYEKTPNTKIQDVLQISYDRLDDNAQQIFLDIACFFKGERMEYVKKILQEFCPTTNMKLLLNKSLITVENGCLKMHDLIQDMGREIVKQESPNPAKRSRIWYYEDAIEILTKDYGSDMIQGFMLDPPQREKVEWSGTELVKMECLRILIVRNTQFSSELEHLPNYLRLLDWEECPSKSFPPKFNPKHIIVLNLPRSRLTLEEPFKGVANSELKQNAS